MAIITTSNLGLNLPSKGEQSWDTLINQNMDKIDNEINNRKNEINTINTQLAENVTQLNNLEDNKADKTALNTTNDNITNLQNNKMDKTTANISVSQINKNLGKFDQTYMTDEFLQQMAGSTPINAIPADYALTSEKYMLHSIKPEHVNFLNRGKNLFDGTTSIDGKQIVTSTGGIADNGTHSVSDFIEVLPNTQYVTNLGNFNVAYYTNQKVFISGASVYSYGILTTPANCYFVRISITPIVNKNTFQFEKGSVSTSYDIFRPYTIDSKALLGVISRWKDKIMNCLGDSLTYGDIVGDGTKGKPWTDYMVQLSGLITCNNYGIGGTRLAGTDTSDMVNRYANMSNNADIISVWGGTNDFCQGFTLGNMGDTTTSTFYGSLDVLIKGLYTKYPNAEIFFITPPKINKPSIGETYTPNSKGLLLKDYRDAIIKVCDKYSIPVLDLYSYSSMSCYLDDGTYRPDKLHYSNAGYQRIAYKIAEFINTL